MKTHIFVFLVIPGMIKNITWSHCQEVSSFFSTIKVTACQNQLIASLPVFKNYVNYLVLQAANYIDVNTKFTVTDNRKYLTIFYILYIIYYIYLSRLLLYGLSSMLKTFGTKSMLVTNELLSMGTSMTAFYRFDPSYFFKIKFNCHTLGTL